MLEGWQQHQTSLSQGNWPCEIIHFTFHEVCSGADLLTLLDLLDHVREGYFSAVFLLPPDDSAGQQPTRTRSQPLGLDGLCPKATRIVRGINQHTELTARFAKQALLCSVHKVATVLIIPEDLGGHPATGPPSLWSMSELQPWKAWMAHTVALASRASSGTPKKVSLQESCRTSHPCPCFFTGSGHSYSKFTTRSQFYLPRPSSRDVSLYDTA